MVQLAKSEHMLKKGGLHFLANLFTGNLANAQ